MSANFTPSLNVYTDLTPFRFWCQKVLPLAYDDSLSYYELLCKVVDYLNKTMEDVSLSIEDVEKLHAAYVSLQGYVNNYFNNLDVQEEINNKLDALVADGTIHEIFTPDVTAILNVARQASLDAIAAIPGEVTDWLDDNISQETGYVIDNTLTVSGAAADAKVTGDKIGELKSDFDDIATATYKPTSPVQDTKLNKYIQSTGNFATSTDYNVYTFPVDGAKSVRIKTNNYAESRNMIVGAFYDSNTDYTSDHLIKYMDIINSNDQTEKTYIYNVPDNAVGFAYACSKNYPESYTRSAELLNPINTVTLDANYKKTQSFANKLEEEMRVDKDEKPNYITGSYIALNVGIGNTVSLEPVSMTGYAHIIIPCVIGDRFTLNGSGASSPRLWGFTDTDYKLLSVANSGATIPSTNPVTFIAENDGFFISNVNSNATDGYNLISNKLESLSDVIETAMGETSPFYRNIRVKKSDVSQYYWGLAPDYTTVIANSSTKYSDIVAHYDALMALYPEYITKSAIGTGSGTDANGNPYTLYEYVFSPRKIVNANDPSIRAKILMDAGIHGFEKNAVSALYYFLEDVCKRWEQNPSLETLRWNVEFHVIPISNPWGFDNNNYVNGNGVNLARNFPCEGWVPVYEPSTQVNGEEPLDQPEAQAIANMINSNQDAFLYLNLHTNGQGDVSPGNSNNIQLKIGIDDNYYNKQFEIAGLHIEKQSALIPTRYPSVTLPSSSFIGRYLVTSENKKGQIDTYCVEWLQLMMASVFEVYNGMEINDITVIQGRSADSKKMCSEMIGNYILNILYGYGF